MSIVTLPNKILRKKSQDVSFPISDEHESIFQEMIDYIDNTANEEGERVGVGIAAIQLGYELNAFYIQLSDEEIEEKYLFINPKILGHSQDWTALQNGEGCLSVLPGSEYINEGLTHRRNKIIFSAYSYFDKKEVRMTFTGYRAVVFQHEFDHLSGILYIDKIDKQNPWEEKKDEKLL